ncbi:uncharacterized protein LOC119683666 isoform X2 [Teleopsis dalmanni]|uniref:uncharacterized protein LOC119683666 isoform X2 n=1 Tax=Teleopsis dalmanni TaxID=139649 RepID=UPI0018CFAB21|nr:uncharacterized protein LOC119683666 isoform X2 [Teleopsis dalmanni]
MLANIRNIRKRLVRRHLDIKECEDDDKDDVHTFTPPTNYIKISQGKIQLVHQPTSLESEANDAQTKKDKSQNGSPTFEKELREQLENMNRVMKSKDRKQIQTCRDHKALQTRFARQENFLHALQQENRALLLRIRQYEHCLDDVMRKVVDAIVAEDNLREEVVMLKSRVRDLEEQNAALSASPAKGRDEGYCTMSSGQPQPSNGHLEDLPEEPEQWLLPAEPCSTEMEDWSMSQEELAVITLDDEREQHQQRQNRENHQPKPNSEHDWIWNTTDFLNSTMLGPDPSTDGISQLLQQKIVYSEDEEVACTEFTNDFYKLVNIRSSSARSLYSYIEGETDDEDDDDCDDSSFSGVNVCLRDQTMKEVGKTQSPTPSEAGRAQVTSCSSSESDELSRCTMQQDIIEENMVQDISNTELNEIEQQSDIEIEDVQLDTELRHLNETQCIEKIIKKELHRPPPLLMKSKSLLEEDEPGCILRNNQRREIESSVVRSGSANGSICANSVLNTNTNNLPERTLQKAANSWRKSNGWKRVTSPLQSPTRVVSPKTEPKTELSKPLQTVTQKLQPTRIPTCKSSPPSSYKQQMQPIRKSKIPPPVPVRRSYAS